MMLTNYLKDKFILREWFMSRELFKKPVLRVYFGVRDTSCYKLYGRLKNAEYKRLARFVSGDPVNYKFRDTEWRMFKKQQTYDKIERKMVWKPGFLNLLKKLHLEDKMPMVVKLPTWADFSFVKRHVYCKSKICHYSFEEPPFISIVIFGISITLYWTAPGWKPDDKIARDYAYWESMFDYLDLKSQGEFDNLSLKEIAERFSTREGYWSDMDGNVSIFNLDHTFIANPTLAEHMRLFNEEMYRRARERREKLKCSKCGHHTLMLDDSVVLTSNPPMYTYRCVNCKSVEYKRERIDD